MGLKTNISGFLQPHCYEGHPSLPLGKFSVYGGSASHPVVHDADIYVSLQAGSTSGRTSDPWDIQQVREVHFSISDTQAPVNVDRFNKMIEWLCNQLQAGKKIHIGCVGGHGRTGLVLTALVAMMLPEEKDAIQYVRDNYCQKVVESKTQVDFLVKHFGVKPSTPSKSFSSASMEDGWLDIGRRPKYQKSLPVYQDEFFTTTTMEKFNQVTPSKKLGGRNVKVIHPVTSTRCLFRYD